MTPGLARVLALAAVVGCSSAPASALSTKSVADQLSGMGIPCADLVGVHRCLADGGNAGRVYLYGGDRLERVVVDHDPDRALAARVQAVLASYARADTAPGETTFTPR